MPTICVAKPGLLTASGILSKQQIMQAEKRISLSHAYLMPAGSAPASHAERLPDADGGS